MHSKQPSAAEQGFPRIYRVGGRGRVNGFLVVLAALFLFFTVPELARSGFHGSSHRDLIVADLAVGLLVTWLGSSYNKRVILYQDAIEVAGWFYSRKLNFAEILGRQTSGSSLRAGYAYIFVPSDKSKRKLVLPPFLRTDQAFRDWVRAIPRIPR